MLNMRSALVLAAAGLCLWALFSLLSHLKEPGLLRSEKSTVLKGCDDVSEVDMRKICAPLICQKHLIDQREVPWNARFTLQQRASASDPRFEIVTGQTDQQISFGCAVLDTRVVGHALADDLKDFLPLANESPESLLTDQGS